MPDFRILDVFQQDHHLIVRAEHFNPDGSFWFLENYIWQGREGLKRKRKTDAQGRILMDDGKPAPLTDHPDVEERRQFLPLGRDWARHDTPHMDEGSILTTIRSIHEQRLVSGWPQGTIDTLALLMGNSQDEVGCPDLIGKFAALAGRAFDR